MKKIQEPKEPMLEHGSLEPIGIVMDWRKVFQSFCLKHGKYWVVYGHRLLFHDGWTHSLNDYNGYKYPPPEDPRALWRLKHFYWSRHQQIVRARLLELEQVYENLIMLIKQDTGDLHPVMVYMDEEEENNLLRKVRREQVPIDVCLDAVQARLDSCRARLKICEENLRSLTEEKQNENGRKPVSRV